MGTTLRGMLLNAYAFATLGSIAMWAAIAAFIGSAVMFVLGLLGLRHAHESVGHRRPCDGAHPGNRLTPPTPRADVSTRGPGRHQPAGAFVVPRPSCSRHRPFRASSGSDARASTGARLARCRTRLMTSATSGSRASWTNRGFGDIPYRANVATAPIREAQMEAAANLLEKAFNALRDADHDRALRMARRAAALPFDEGEQAQPGAYQAHMMMFMVVTDELEDVEGEGWLDAALDALVTSPEHGRFTMRDCLVAISEDYDLSPDDLKRIRRSVAHVPSRPSFKSSVSRATRWPRHCSRSCAASSRSRTLWGDPARHLPQRRTAASEPPGQRRWDDVSAPRRGTSPYGRRAPVSPIPRRGLESSRTVA